VVRFEIVVVLSTLTPIALEVPLELIAPSLITVKLPPLSKSTPGFPEIVVPDELLTLASLT
jgi:hypothetical protein